MSSPKELKTGVELGGTQPKYLWTVVYLTLARDEAMAFLDESQYHHIVDQIKDLAQERDPKDCKTADVKPIEEIFELRDKGGPLGKINVRIYFGIDDKARAIVVLGGIKKESEGMLPVSTRIRMQRRWRKYQSGDYSAGK